MVINMKKKIIILVSILVIALAIGGLVYASVTLNKKTEEMENHLIEISFTELQKKIDNKETFILVYTQESCSHCMMYKPTLKEVLYENNIYAYELQTNKLTKEEAAKLKDIANADGTPNTIFIKDGQEISTNVRLVGNQPKSNIVSRFKTLGYIK